MLIYKRSLPTRGSYTATNQVCSYLLGIFSDSFKPVSLFTLNFKKIPFLADYLQVKHVSL